MCIEPRRQSGITLIELIIFIVIVSAGLAGVLTVMNVTAKSSADPMVRKQALAIAEAILEEAMLQPFTWCDPDDAAAATATGSAGCTGGTNGANDESKTPLGPESGDARGTYDNVSDYNGLSTTSNIAGGGAALYTATVTVANSALDTVPAGASLLITVSVTAGGETIEVQGYRTRYAPNSLP